MLNLTINYLNNNPAALELISLGVISLITIVGFFITNKNVTKTKNSQSQKAKDNAIQNQWMGSDSPKNNK